MDTLQFFKRVLADQPNHVLTLGTLKDGQRIFWNRNYSTLESMASAALRFDGEGLTVYHALGSFKDNELPPDDRGRVKVLRKAVQATQFKTLACDIDVGPGKPYAAQMDALRALAEAVKAVGLPAPLLVSSGLGVHAYWPLTVAVSRPDWTALSTTLRDRLAGKVHIDTTKVCDPAMVLRPIGTSNRKGEHSLTVRLLRDAQDSSPDALRALLGPASQPAAGAPAAGQKRTSAALAAVLEGDALPLADPRQVALKCGQIAAVAGLGGNVPEPVWYLSLGIANHCTSPEETAKAWSSGHPDYDEISTLRKLHQWKERTTGPATCAAFEKLNPTVCASCQYRGKVITPIQLYIPPAPDADDESALPLPRGYRLVGKKIVRVLDGVALPVCNFPLIVKERYFDPVQGKMIALLEAQLPAEGTKHIELPIDTLAAGKDKWMGFLFNNSIAPGPTAEHANATRQFIVTYLEELQRKSKPVDTYNRFGWANNNFILGPRRYSATGVEDIELAPTITSDMRGAYVTKGSLAEWVKLTRLLDTAGLEFHAMCLLVGMGAPFLAFTDLDGFVISMYSPESGTGKTTTGHWINSVWGHPRAIQIGRNDTMNAMYHTMVLLNNLPAYFEEITNITPEQTSDFVYNAATGRERRRLTQTAELREAGSWKLPVFASTNRSLVQKLQNNKLSSEGELQRIIEYPFHRNAVFDGATDGTPVGLKIATVLRDNHGVAGDTLMRALLRVPDMRVLVSSAYSAFTKEFGFEFTAKERFFQAAHTIAYMAGKLGTKLGLIEFDYKRVIEKSLKYVRANQSETALMRTDAYDVVGMFTNEHTNSLVCEVTDTSRTHPTAIARLPPVVKDLRARLEAVHDGKGNMSAAQLFVDRAYFNRWCQTHGVDGGDVVEQLNTEGVSVKSLRISLGRRTPVVTTAVYCYQIDVKHPRFASVLSGVDATRDGMLVLIEGGKK